MSPETAAQRHLTCVTWSQLRRNKKGGEKTRSPGAPDCLLGSQLPNPFTMEPCYTELLEMLMFNDLLYMKKMDNEKLLQCLHMRP